MNCPGQACGGVQQQAYHKYQLSPVIVKELADFFAEAPLNITRSFEDGDGPVAFKGIVAPAYKIGVSGHPVKLANSCTVADFVSSHEEALL